jgi:hypothetical protein
VVAFYGFASAVYLETMSSLPADKKRVERLKEIFEEDSAKSITPLTRTPFYPLYPSFCVVWGFNVDGRYRCVSGGAGVGVFTKWLSKRRGGSTT